MSEQQTQSPRKRLHALLAIPESQRTDAQWDELNELEIMTAPVNQLAAPKRDARRAGPPRARPAKQNNGERRNKQPVRKPRKRPRSTGSPS